MSINNSGNFMDGIQIEGAQIPFMPVNEGLSYTIVEANGRTCGVLLDLDPAPMLRFYPDWQLPKGARDRREWNRFRFDCEDDMLVALDIDFRDGEVRFFDRVELDGQDRERVEAKVNETVQWITRLYPQFVTFVRQQLVERKGLASV